MKHAEATLLQHLDNADSLDYMAREGLITEKYRVIIPTPEVKVLIAWALELFFESGRIVAPSATALRETWADHLEQYDIKIDFDSEPDSVQWAITDLRSNYARIEAETLMNLFAKEMGEADGPAKVEVFGKYVDLMFVTHEALITRRFEMDGERGVEDAIQRLDERAADGLVTRGLLLGIPEIDAHTFGTHPGEITTIAAPPGKGKSWAAGYITIKNWEMGKKIVLVTLENSIEMTYDRLCCMATAVDYEMWQKGTITTAQRDAVVALRTKMSESDCKPIIVQLDESQRTASGVVRKAMLEDADGIVVDQLSFMEAEAGTQGNKRNERVVEIMRRLHVLITQGVFRVPVILFSQMTRDGISAARKSGRFFQEDMADSRSVEQFSSNIWAIYQSDDMLVTRTVEWQQLKSRRTTLRNFPVMWRPEIGFVKVVPSG